MSSNKHPYAIEIDDHGDPLSPDAGEIARIWIDDAARVWIAAYRLEDPREFGRLMADTVRHAARAYAGTWSLDEQEALQKIVDGLGGELRDQFRTITTVQDGSLS